MPQAVQEHFDVVVVGAGLSGVGAGAHFRMRCPDRSYVILEGRERMGGTWDLFRYPGIRSDSDMYTLGYSFRPWTNAKAIADGPSILAYVKDTAREYGVDEHVRYGHRVTKASWDGARARWSVEAETGEGGGEVRRFSCRFLYLCSGYYRYDRGYTPEFVDLERFAGRVVHPQFWDESLDYAGKRIVVIGSGATAVTLVPELAKDAAHVTMLQRSPTYMASGPAEDRMANWLRAKLPARLAYGITRWRHVLFGMLFFGLSRRRPAMVARALIGRARKELPAGYDVETHFTPRYNPWDQRLCLVTDGDLFQAIREDRAGVVTDRVERFTEEGIRLGSGDELEADIVVMATGLELVPLGGVALEVDGRPVTLAETMAYKGMMYSDVPNLASAMGYTNASWTLKCDLTCAYVCRLLNHMKRKGLDVCTPRQKDASVVEEPYLDFSSGYVQRALHLFPKQGSKTPWKLYQNYLFDLMTLGMGRLEDGVMEWSRAGEVAGERELESQPAAVAGGR